MSLLLTALLLLQIISCSFGVTLSIKNVCRYMGDYNPGMSGNPNCWHNPDMMLSTHSGTNGYIDWTKAEMIEKYAERHESYDVVTPDGYILTMFRLPARANSKGVVLMQHPFLTDGRIWLTQGNTSSALVFWRDGWDVWLGNQRGTENSERHVNLTSGNSTFWDWSFDDVGQNDIPTQIRLIRSKTENAKIYYMGHSMGTTNALVYASSMQQEAQDSVEVFIMAAPACYFTGIKSAASLLPTFVPIAKFAVEALDLGPMFPILPTIYQAVRIFHRIFPRFALVLNFMTSAFFGWALDEMDPQFLNLDMIMNLKNCSWKMFFHYVQLITNKDKFTMYHYGADKNRKLYGGSRPPLYPLWNITAPLYLISSSSDSLTGVLDADLLYDRLGPAAKKYGKLHITILNHVDFHSGKHRLEYYIYPALKLANFIRSQK